MARRRMVSRKTEDRLWEIAVIALGILLAGAVVWGLSR